MRFPFASIILATITLLSSCREEEVAPAQNVRYTDLQNREVGYNQSFSLDADGDGTNEFSFTTGLQQEDGTNQLHYKVVALRSNRVFETSGQATKFQEGQEITPGNIFDKNVSPLVAKVESNGSIRWEGDWKDASNHYLGIQFSLSDGKMYYGWVRISFNRVTEKLIVHDFAYHKEANSKLLAGKK